MNSGRFGSKAIFYERPYWKLGDSLNRQFILSVWRSRYIIYQICIVVMCLLHGVAFDRPSMAQTALLSALRSNKCVSSGRIPLASSWACKGKRNSGVPKSGWCVTAHAECYLWDTSSLGRRFLLVFPYISDSSDINIVSIAYDCSIDCSQLLRRLLDRLLPSKVGARASKSHWR